MAKITLFVVPHTHYDAEVFLTRDATLKWGSEHILEALYLLETDPDYRFVLDQRCYVDGFAELFPEQFARLKTHVATGRLEIAGRDEELAMLLRRWRQATEGEGQVILLSGEPGIGKSRVTRALREAIEHEAHTRLRYQCSPFHTRSALYPLINQFERAAGFAKEDRAEDRFDKLEALLRLARDKEEIPSIAPQGH